MSAEWPPATPGAKGPRVKALQRLHPLDRGAEVGVDGAVGPHTRQSLVVER